MIETGRLAMNLRTEIKSRGGDFFGLSCIRPELMPTAGRMRVITYNRIDLIHCILGLFRPALVRLNWVWLLYTKYFLFIKCIA